MLHRAHVEWPCLSIDVLLPSRFSHADAPSSHEAWFPQYVHKLNPAEAKAHEESKKEEAAMEGAPKDKKSEAEPAVQRHESDRYPYDVYVVSGSQAFKKTENKLYVMKFVDLGKTLHDEEEAPAIDEEEEEEEKDATIYCEALQHRGCVNRVRSLHGTSIVATWSDERDVSIFNVRGALEIVEQKHRAGSNDIGRTKKLTPLVRSFKHSQEGYALDWSPLRWATLASGGCDRLIYTYTACDELCSDFVMSNKDAPLKGHTDSVEDLQFSPSQEHVIASCSVDRTIRIWDLRDGKKPKLSWEAHESDVNVISWNTECKYLLSSGADDGCFRVWDLREVQRSAKKGAGEAKPSPITDIRWHSGPITSLQF